METEKLKGKSQLEKERMQLQHRIDAAKAKTEEAVAAQRKSVAKEEQELANMQRQEEALKARLINERSEANKKEEASKAALAQLQSEANAVHEELNKLDEANPLRAAKL